MINGKQYSHSALRDYCSALRDDRNTPAWEKDIGQFVTDWIDPKNNSIQMQTSGSTGKPTQVFHSKSAMIASAGRTCEFFDLGEGNKALLVLPTKFVGGMMMVVRALTHGLDLYWSEPARNPMSAAFDLKIDFCAMTPLQLQSVIDSGGHAILKLNNLKQIILGGSPISFSLNNKIQQLTSTCYQTYGMTETITHVALKILNGPEKSDSYQLLEGVTMTQDHRSCAVIKDELCSISSLTTNDVVQMVEPNYFNWLGRVDDVMNSGGLKIHPDELSAMLSTDLEFPFIVTSIQDDVLGEKVVLIVEIEQNQPIESLTHQIQKTCSRLGTKRPRRVYFIDRIRNLASDKTDKRATLEAALSQNWFIEL